MPKQTYGKHPGHRIHVRQHAPEVISLLLISLAIVGSIALLSRAELRLSGETFAAEENIQLMFRNGNPFVERLREGLYKVTNEGEIFILERLDSGEWAIERAHR
jgi:hypothetical protein